MAFPEFEQAIRSPALKQVARHWNDARGEGRVPSWSDIRPSALAAQLPIIWSWKYDPERDEFTGRLAGDAIEAVFGKSFRGRPMAEVFGPEQVEQIATRHRRVVTEPALYHGDGLVFRHIDRYGSGERIILPLTDGILGATVYENLEGAHGNVSLAAEQETWFPLD